MIMVIYDYSFEILVVIVWLYFLSKETKIDNTMRCMLVTGPKIIPYSSIDGGIKGLYFSAHWVCTKTTSLSSIQLQIGLHVTIVSPSIHFLKINQSIISFYHEKMRYYIRWPLWWKPKPDQERKMPTDPLPKSRKTHFE